MYHLWSSPDHSQSLRRQKGVKIPWMLRRRITWRCGSLMAGMGTLLNLAVRDNYTSIHFSLIRFIQELLKSSYAASTGSFTLIFLLLYNFTDLKSHNTSLTTGSPTPSIHFTEGTALHGWSRALLWSSGPEGCRHD